MRELIANKVAGSDAYKVTAGEIAKDLLSGLPRECRHILGEDELAFNNIVERLIAEGCEDVLARLHERPADDEAG